MKADELMIGDWVQIVEPCKYAGAIGRIKTLIDHKDNENAYFKVFLRNNTICIGIEDICSEDIRPIPLTPEILEKNGFKRDPLWHHCDKDLDNHSISIQLGYANKIEYIKIVEKGKDDVVPSERTKMYLTHVFYLHQLQQAMRIMGCDKEIEL